jgi:ketosteroid isomerase-like protein
MSQQNVEAFKRGLEAGNRGDVETLLEVLDPEVAWHSALHALMGGEATVYRGHDGVRERLPIGFVTEFKNGNATSIRAYLDPKEALEAAGPLE